MVNTFNILLQYHKNYIYFCWVQRKYVDILTNIFLVMFYILLRFVFYWWGSLGKCATLVITCPCLFSSKVITVAAHLGWGKIPLKSFLAPFYCTQDSAVSISVGRTVEGSGFESQEGEECILLCVCCCIYVFFLQ